MGPSKTLRPGRLEVRGRVWAEEIFPTGPTGGDSVCRCLSVHDSVQLIKPKTSNQRCHSGDKQTAAPSESQRIKKKIEGWPRE